MPQSVWEMSNADSQLRIPYIVLALYSRTGMKATVDVGVSRILRGGHLTQRQPCKSQRITPDC